MIKKHKRYRKPKKIYDKARIEEENRLIKKYGLKNKREIWKMVSKLRDFSRQAKSLIASITPQGEKEKKQLLSKLDSLNMLPENANLDDVMGLTTKDIMERRLQTIVYRKGLAASSRQARQFIVHGHIMVGNKKITVPSYLVRKDEEGLVNFVPTSSIPSLENQQNANKKSKEKTAP